MVEDLEKFEEENRRLRDEKANLLAIEAQLEARVTEGAATRKQENAELKLEIENLKKRCENLAELLNKQTTNKTD